MSEGLWIFLEIMLINIVLSGDNAVVIGMASKSLPEKERKRAVWWGAFGAIALRLILIAAAVTMLKVPLLQALGAFLLAYIAIKLLTDDEHQTGVRSSASLGKAVRTIIAADFIMSLDNVLAIAAVANGNYTIVIAGVALSIPVIIWGSSFIAVLLVRYPILVYLGSALLGYTAGEMFVNDAKMKEWFVGVHSSFHWMVPLCFAVVVVTAGWVYRFGRRAKR